MPALNRVVVSFALLFAASFSHAETPMFATDNGAIRGYDPVAYFTDDQAVKGSAEFTVDWNGATWRFASAANRDAFADDPARYAPQYGGHCAYAMSTGKLVPTDLEAWHIVDGKLYLNYSKRVQRRWLQDVPGYVAKADAQWTTKHAMAAADPRAD